VDALVRGKWFDGLEVRKAEERRKEQDVDVAGCCGEENESTLHFMLSGVGSRIRPLPGINKYGGRFCRFCRFCVDEKRARTDGHAKVKKASAMRPIGTIRQ
jgi:hypothetical protein